MKLAKLTHLRPYSNSEEVANWITHGVAAVVAVVGLVLLARMAAERGDTWNVVGCWVFGITMVVLYAASTIYHAVPCSAEAVKLRWRRYDQAAIFLLIAGSYTPFVLANLRTPVGWAMLAFVWVAAILGVVGELTERTHSTKLRVGIYLAMGWSAVMAAGPILEAMPMAGLGLIGLGGLAYTIGVVFFMWRQLRYHHAVWHLFVIAGTACHYAAVVNYAIPTAIA